MIHMANSASSGPSLNAQGTRQMHMAVVKKKWTQLARVGNGMPCRSARARLVRLLAFRRPSAISTRLLPAIMDTDELLCGLPSSSDHHVPWRNFWQSTTIGHDIDDGHFANTDSTDGEGGGYHNELAERFWLSARTKPCAI